MPADTHPLILVVDDDTRSARLLAQLLREDGYLVEVAGDGAAAVGRLSRPPSLDVLITDMQLPYVDGAALARYARSERSDFPVIFVTGYPQLVPSDASGARSVVFTKPIEYDALRAALVRLCGVSA